MIKKAASIVDLSLYLRLYLKNMDEEFIKFIKSMLIGISRDMTRIELKMEKLHEEIKELRKD